MRADALPYVLGNADNTKSGVSGIAELAEKGGVYLAYCGGETGTATQQQTSTSACWTSHFTGVWGDKHGILTNDDSKNMQYKTFMLEYAEKGLHTAVAFDWDQYFDLNLKEEVKYVLENRLPMQICDTDRVKTHKLKNTFAETLELYNFIAPETPSVSAPQDSGMRDYILARIEADDDVICGIFHNIDTAGHNFGFGESTEYRGAVINCDMYAHSVLNVLNERKKKYNEEWLVVFASDHGGHGRCAALLHTAEGFFLKGCNPSRFISRRRIFADGLIVRNEIFFIMIDKSIAHRYLPVALCLFLIVSAGALSRNFLLFCMCCGTITLRTSKEAELPRIAENIVS